MEDQDPIKQLQSLLTDRGRVLERISGIQAVLNSIKGAETGAVDEATAVARAANLAPAEDPYERLLHMLRDMQLQIENQVRPLARQAVVFEIERLQERTGIERTALHDCLDHLDGCLRNCVASAEEYRCGHAKLAQLNQRLTALGAMAEPLPECAAEIGDIINSRLELLTREEKI